MRNGQLIKLLHHKETNRGMQLIPEMSRCIRRYEIHELVVTDSRNLVGGSRVDRVGFLGFVEFFKPCVIQAGAVLWINNRMIGSVVGFDDCHYPNHYNIVVEAPSLLTADDLALRVGEEVLFDDSQQYRVSGNIESEVEVPVTVIVGFGRCGRLLHLPTVQRIRQQLFGRAMVEEVFAIDPYAERKSKEFIHAAKQCTWIDNFSNVPPSARSRAVVHICTPPHCRSDVIEAAAKLGMRQFLIEKPMAQTIEEQKAIFKLKQKFQLEIFVVSNWTSSVLTYKIKKYLEEKASNDIFSSLIIRQSKSRISRSLSNSSHQSTFDVELPHMVALACLLSGQNIRFNSASCWDMIVDNKSICDMGGGEIVFEMINEKKIYLRADHMAPVRERSIEINFNSGSSLKGFYPCMSDDLYSQLYEYNSDSFLISRELFEDDTLARFFTETYEYFLGSNVKPISNFDFNVTVCSLLSQAKQYCSLKVKSSNLNLT